tara:strand:+ start:390 stop:515 length:126 start_codon:yes stop_codon:yes gene_type:complete
MNHIELLIPYIIFGALGISAILGIRELAKESTTAMKRKSVA